MRLPLSISGLAALALALVGTPVAAQSTYFFSPQRLAATEGDNACYLFGSWQKARHQLVDGENRGTAAQLKAVAFRLDYRSHTSWTTAIGRSWSNVTVDLSDGDLDKMTNVFTLNTLSTPTRVFSGAVTWPDYNGTPLSRPTLWGGISNSYRVPFRTNWNYTGRLDIVSDWQFVGGQLANRSTWTTASTGYWLDSYEDPDEPRVGTYRPIPKNRLNNNSPGVTGRCNDSFFGSQGIGSHANIFARAYGPSTSQTNWRDKLLIWSSSYYTAPGAPVIHAWAFASHDIGFGLSTGCNNLHLLGLQLYFPHAVPPSSKNPTGYVRAQPIITDWVGVMSSLRVVLQAGWADSVTGQFRLSQAHEVILPQDRPPPLPRRGALYEEPTSPVRGPDQSYIMNPAMRYER
jgi:hypothetical protein